MNIAADLVQMLQQNQWHIRCVESCTAGGLTAAIASISGASSVLDRSWVTYSNQSKHEEVGVPLETIKRYGAVSEPVVLAMVEGAIQDCADNTVAISISGIAGPTGGSTDKPVGTVWIGIKIPQQKPYAQCFHFKGHRVEIQMQAIEQALTMPLQN